MLLKTPKTAPHVTPFFQFGYGSSSLHCCDSLGISFICADNVWITRGYEPSGASALFDVSDFHRDMVDLAVPALSGVVEDG